MSPIDNDPWNIDKKIAARKAQPTDIDLMNKAYVGKARLVVILGAVATIALGIAAWCLFFS